MPESPEVQVLVEFLDERLRGRAITAIDVEEFRAWKTRARPAESMVGATISGAARFGKHLDLTTDRGHLVITFGRAGWAAYEPAGEGPPDAADITDSATDPRPPVIVTLGLDDGARLALTDAADWLSLGVSAVDAASDVAAVAGLGPDPTAADFTRADFDARTRGRRKQLKALLQEQETFSGIGNAYSDEILHVARLSPIRHAASLTDEEADRLFRALRDVPAEATAARRGIPIDALKAAKVAAMRVHGRTGESCPVCGSTVADLPSSKGKAQYCPGCQNDGAAIPA